MSQSGLHGLTGLYAARWIRNHCRPAKGFTDAAAGCSPGWLSYGIVLGSIFPDIDFFLLGPVYLWDSQAALLLHRSWSHSLIFQALLTLGLLHFWAGAHPARRYGIFGFGLGMLLHSVADLFLWFSAIDLFWPLSVWGWLQPVHIWSGISPPGWVSNFLGALDYLFFLLFFRQLAFMSERAGLQARAVCLARRIEPVLAALFLLYTFLSFVLSAAPGLFNLLHYTVFILIFLPFELWLVVSARKVIASA